MKEWILWLGLGAGVVYLLTRSKKVDAMSDDEIKLVQQKLQSASKSPECLACDAATKNVGESAIFWLPECSPCLKLMETISGISREELQKLFFKLQAMALQSTGAQIGPNP